MVIGLLMVFCAESLSRKKLRSTAAELIISLLPWKKVCSLFCGFLQAEPLPKGDAAQTEETSYYNDFVSTGVER
ncbi:hypothetical protein NSTCB13_04502 [Nostoc sp. DSM 114160]|jgi:hypothetical protein